MSTALTLLALLGMAGSLVAVPLGLPGIWVQVALLFGLGALGEVAWTLAGVGLVAAAVAEGLELLVVRAMGRRYGGSHRAFWGALAGGMAGLFVGLPVPVVGPLITGFLGTFVGAGAVTLWETRSLGASARVGWGVLLARTVAVGIKMGVGVALLAAAGLSVLFAEG